MFGGLAFLLRGNMCVGIVKGDLMVRVGPDAHARLARLNGARPMDFTGRPMKGFLFVDSRDLDADTALERWVGYGVAFARSLPQKKTSAATSSGASRGRGRALL
jgi:TfoX/Sxy family transcriptional regulator of competence genes